MKPLFTKDHAEIIATIWDGMPDDVKVSLFSAVAFSLGAKSVEGGPQKEIAFSEVVRASWCLGFHYAMTAMETGALVKVGNPKDN